MTPTDSSAGRPLSTKRVALVLSAVGVLATLLVGFLHSRGAGGADEADATSLQLREGDQVHVWVSSVELGSQPSDGGDWDVDGSAPDPRVELRFNEVSVGGSFPAREDSFIGNWHGFDDGWMGLGKTRRLLKGEPPSSEAVAAPILRFGAEGTLEVRVFDADPGMDDAAGTHRIPLSSLLAGTNVLNPPPGDPSDVVRMEVRVVPRGIPSRELWRQLGAGGESGD